MGIFMNSPFLFVVHCYYLSYHIVIWRSRVALRTLENGAPEAEINIYVMCFWFISFVTAVEEPRKLYRFKEDHFDLIDSLCSGKPLGCGDLLNGNQQ